MNNDELKEALEYFECQRCGNCCAGPGYVFVTESEVDAMAAELGMEPHAFADKYTRLTADRRGLALADAENGGCIFLNPDNTCRVQAAKPRQCRDFPYKWTFPKLEERCPGVREALRKHAESKGAESKGAESYRSKPK